MSELSALGKVMHEEHFRTLVLICGLENRVTGAAGNRPIDLDNDEDRALILELIAGLEDIVGHHTFEETVLFPLLRSEGAGDLAELLTQEHFVIGPLAKRVHALAVEILEDGITAPLWAVFRNAAVDLTSYMMMHLQKEEMAVVQQLGTLLDPKVDHALARRFISERHGCPTRLETAADQVA